MWMENLEERFRFVIIVGVDGDLLFGFIIFNEILADWNVWLNFEKL